MNRYQIAPLRLYRIALAFCLSVILLLCLDHFQMRVLNAHLQERLRIEREDANNEISLWRLEAEVAQEQWRRARRSQKLVGAIAQDAQEELARHLTLERNLITPADAGDRGR